MAASRKEDNAASHDQGMAVKALPTKDLILCQEGENSIKELKDRLHDLGGQKKVQEQEQQLEQGESLFSFKHMEGITGSKRMTAEDRMANEGVARGHVKKYLRKELAEANSCLNLPFAFGAFLFFILGTTAHLRLEELHAADRSATFDIMENVNFAFSGSAPYENGRMGHKTILDVNTYADYWSWFTLGIAPIFFPEGWDVSETRANTLAICQTFKEGVEGFGWNDDAIDGVNDVEGIFGDIGTPCPEGDDLPQRPDDYYGGPFSPTYLWYNFIVGGLRMRQEYSDPINCINEDYRDRVFTGQCTPDNGYQLVPDLWRAMYTDDAKTDNSEELEAFFKHTTTLAIRFQELKRVLSFYPFVLVTAFLKQFANQQRLAMFTTTLVSASVDIAHFGVVWFTLFLLWVISAMLLFGQEIEEFASFERATMAVFRTLHGDFDWDQLNRVGRLEGMLWFWTYHILVFFIMTNMLLAIVMDWYAEVKGSVGSDAETLWSQVSEIIQRRRAIMKGEALPMKFILSKLDPTDLDSEDDLDDGEKLTISKFRKEVEGLRYKQAYDILQASQGDLDALERDGTSIAATNQRVFEMDEVLSNLYVNLQREKIYFDRVQEQQAAQMHSPSEHRRHMGHSPSGAGRHGHGVGHERSAGTGSRGGHSCAVTPSEGGPHGGHAHSDHGARAGHTPATRPHFAPPDRTN